MRITAEGFYNFITALEETMQDKEGDYLTKEVKVELNKWLSEGGDINALADDSGNTLLHRAVLKKRVVLAQALLDCEADGDLPNNNGQTAREIAKAKKLSIDFFMPKVAPSHPSGSSSAAEEAAPSACNSALVFDYNLLLKGLNEESLEMYISAIKGQGHDINAFNERGLTALHEACYDCNLMVIKMLVKYGADVNLKTLKEKMTCMILVVLGNKESSSIEFVKFMQTTNYNCWGDTAVFDCTQNK